MQPFAWELPYVMGVDLKKKKKDAFLFILYFYFIFVLFRAVLVAYGGVRSELQLPAYTTATDSNARSELCL